jgi:lactam utilization protein B
MLFARRPYHLSEEEADRWMRSQVTALTRSAAASGVQVSRLRAPASRAGEWDWLIEMHFDDADDAVRAAHVDACRDFVADLRLLGMSPRLVLADATRPLDG